MMNMILKQVALLIYMVFRFPSYYVCSGYKRTCDYAGSGTSTVLVKSGMVYTLMLQDTGYAPYSVPLY